MFVDLARRGLQHPSALAFVKRTGYPRTQVDLPDISPWAAGLVTVSFWVAMISVFLLSYMLHEVITTLCMVESPSAAITVSPSHETGDKEEKEGLLETGPVITLVNQKPITASIRGTVRHLVNNAGHFARFRGIRIHMAYAFLFAIVSTSFNVFFFWLPGSAVLVAGLTGVVLSNFHATWTHKVVSMPSNKSFLERYRAATQWKILALPAFIEAAMPYVSLYLTCGVAMLLNLHNLEHEKFETYNGADFACLFAKIGFVFVFLMVCSLFLCLPAVVTLVRIEASILPEDEDTIVPFDRTFGGKVVSQMMGGTGKIGFLDAWRSFKWEARRRLIKLFIKSTLILSGLMFIIIHVLVAEVYVVMGPALGKFLSQIRDNQQ